MIKITLLAIYLLPYCVFSQSIKSPFNSTNEWVFSTTSGSADFTLIDGVLQSKGPTDLGSRLFAAFPHDSDLVREEVAWHLGISYPHNPSNSNSIRIMLISDNVDTYTSSGIGFEVGQSGNPDPVRFFKSENGKDSILFETSDIVSTLELMVSIKSSDGNWLFRESITGYEAVFRSDQIKGNYVSIGVKHTGSRSNMFSFKDFTVQSTLLPDTVPPAVLNFSVPSLTEVHLEFTEPVEPELTYQLQDHQISSRFSSSYRAKLTIDPPLKNGKDYPLNLVNLTDKQQNTADTLVLLLTVFVPDTAKFRSVVINEIMADPIPSKGLDEVEYVELYNHSDLYINLDGWKISDGKDVSLPAYNLYPGELVLLRADSFELPGLNNQSDVLTLHDNFGRLVDSVFYKNTWQNEDKMDGGFSLELINPLSPCSSASNWGSSEAAEGGTPGKKNSLHDTTDVKVKVINHFPTGTNQLIVICSNELYKPFLETLKIEGKELGIEDISLTNDWSDSLIVTFTAPADTGVEYKFMITEGQTCAGNIRNQPFSFFIGEKASFGDIVINEIMADPTPSAGLAEVEYIELFNASDKTFSLQNWYIHGKRITDNHFIKPGEYKLIADLAHALKPKGWGVNTIHNTYDRIELRNPDSVLIDLAIYDQQQLFYDAYTDGGYAMERLSPSTSCHFRENWKPTKDLLGGTPGAPNSWSKNVMDSSPAIILGYWNSGDSLLIHSNEYMWDGLNLEKDFWVHPKIEEATYEVSLTDCSGNSKNYLLNRYPQSTGGDGLVINEIMFEGRDREADFIELFNSNSATINLQHYRMALLNEGLEQVIQFSDQPTAILPNEYLVLTSNPTIFHYWYDIETRLLPVCPPLNNTSDTLLLFNAEGQSFDTVVYNSQWHSPILDDPKGVSLERIHFKKNGLFANSWHSAASSAGFSSPGRVNSQMKQSLELSQNLKPEPELFLPGKQTCAIHYSFPNEGTIGDLAIFDRYGKIVKTIASNYLFGSKGVLLWDGSSDDGNMLAMDNYVAIFRGIDSAGHAVISRARIAIGYR